MRGFAVIALNEVIDDNFPAGLDLCFAERIGRRHLKIIQKRYAGSDISFEVSDSIRELLRLGVEVDKYTADEFLELN